MNQPPRKLPCTALLAALLLSAQGTPQITEFVAINAASHSDGDGKTPDWIEIHNPEAASFDLSGHHLTDDLETPEQYTFPDGTMIPGGGYLVVFASGDARVDSEGNLHTNFSLASEGEYFALNAPDGTVIHQFTPTYPRQFEDVSYGIGTSDAAGNFGYFTKPTPGATNGSTPLIGFVADTKFSHDRGYHTEAFDLVITSATPGATIIYTTDGTPPSPDTGNIFVNTMNGTVYTEPIRIQGTTTLRAIATKEDYQSTNIDTQTYLFIDDILRQERPDDYPTTWAGASADYDMDPDIVDHPDYADSFQEAFAALPTLSLVFDPDAFFDRSTGIYQRPDGEGSNWERPLSAEFMVPDGSEPGFQINAGVRVQGGSSRNADTPKHSLSLRFRAEYGAEKLRYPLFENTPGGESAVDRFDVLQLRPEYNFGWMHRHWYQAHFALYGRDQWASDMFIAMGQNGSRGRWTHLFLNGIYWGLYDLHERPDADHMANYFGGNDDDYDTVNSSIATRGDLNAYNEMMNLAYGNIESDVTYKAIEEYLDIDNFIDYMILNAYVGNRDWDGHNWRAARRREAGAGYLFFPWDTEFAASHVGGGAFPSPPDFFSTALETDVTTKDGSRRPTGLQQRLARNDAYRLRYADRVQKHFFNGGALTPKSASALWLARSASMQKAIVAESARWGDFRRDVNPGRWTREQFDLFTRDDHYLPTHQWFVETYIPQRADIVLSQFRSRNLYPRATAPTFSQHGGTVSRGFELQIDATTAVQYTTDGSDPRLANGELNPNAQQGKVLTLNESTHLKARSRSIFGDWSALSEAFFTVGSDTLQFSEIMYHPADPEPRAEFIELYNSADFAVSLSGLRFTKGITFDFDQHASATILAPNSRILLVRDLEAFRTVYGDALDDRIVGTFQDGTSLSNSGETITLSDANNTTILTLRYNDKDPWPINADGQGKSLVYVGGSPDTAQSWGASESAKGNPGLEDTVEEAPNAIFAAPLEIERSADGIRLTYKLTVSDEERTIAVEQSSHLESWETIEPNIVNDSLDEASAIRTVTLEIPQETSGYLRVVATPAN